MASFRFFLWFVIAGISGLPTSASASPTYAADVQTIQGDCQQPTSSPEWTYCLGLLEGVSSILSANGYLLSSGLLASGDLEKVAMCPSSNILGEELLKVFVGWATAHPEAARDPDAIGVSQAFAERWPCTHG